MKSPQVWFPILALSALALYGCYGPAKWAPPSTDRAYSQVSHKDGHEVAEVNTELAYVSKQVPCEASLHAPFEVELRVYAHENIANVVVRDTIPEQARFVRSEPGAMVKGNQMSWRFDRMNSRESQTIHYWLEPQAQGKLCSSITISAEPLANSCTRVGQASLSCTTKAPREVCCGQSFQYRVKVKNEGTTTAKEVSVQDTLPEGFQFADGKRTQTVEIGPLQVGQKHTQTFTAYAKAKGSFQHVVTAWASNAPKVSSSVIHDAHGTGLEVLPLSKGNPSVGQGATYEVRVHNPTDKPLEQIVITERAPGGVYISDAEGACIESNQAVWTLPRLNPGEAKTLRFTIATNNLGRHQHRLTQTSMHAPAQEINLTTEWVQPPSLAIESAPTRIPLMAGQESLYHIRAINQSPRAANHTQVTVVLPPEILPVEASGNAKARIEGQTITFTPTLPLKPKQVLEFTIKGRAVNEGEGQIRAEMVSDALDAPAIEEHPIHVY